MIDVLQELVERLAEELRRSVAVDDAGLRLLASSTHFEDVDAARLNSLVGRRVSGAVRDYVMSSGVQNWHGPTVLAANPGVGLDGDRLVFPLRTKYELLGLMWLLDDGTLTSSEIALAREAAAQIEDLLARRAQSADDADIELEAIVLALLATESAARRQAAADMRDLGLFRRAEALGVVVVRARPSTVGPSEAVVREAVRHGFVNAAHGHLRGHHAFAITSDVSVLILGFRSNPLGSQSQLMAQSVFDSVANFAPKVASIITVGTGEVVDRLARVHEAFDQADRACNVGVAIEQSVVVWGNHPLETLLSSWLQSQLPAHLIPSVVRELMRQPAETLATVEAFLDYGGNVARTASMLHLHRTTVYFRLGRLKEIGIDLNEGSIRLLAHLWLKSRPFSDVSPPSLEQI